MSANSRLASNSKISVAMIGSRGFTVSYSGLETHVRELAECLVGEGNHVTVYGRADRNIKRLPKDQYDASMVKIMDGFCLGGKLTATISNSIWATISAVQSRRFDLLHYHGVGCVFGLILAKLCKMPTILSLHSTNWQEDKWSGISKILIHSLEKLAVRLSDNVIVVSQALASRIRQEYGIEACAIPNGVRIKGKPEWDSGVLSELGLEKDTYILYAGRIVADKGCHILLEAFLQANLNIKLVLAGPLHDQNYCRRLKTCASDDVVITGNLHDSELGALYRNCRLFCSASVSEGQSIVLLEALAHDAACMVSDIPAHQELVENPKMRFRVGDVSALSSKLLEFQSASTHAVENDWLQKNPQYSFDHTVQKVIEVYKNVLSRY